MRICETSTHSLNNRHRASVLIQHIYQDMDMKSPFFLTYMANSLLVIYLPLWQLWICCGLVKTDAKTGAMSSTDGESNPADTKIIVNRLHDDAFSDVVSIDESFIENDLNPVVAPTKSYTHWDVLKIAAIICPFWFLSNCLYNYSLFLTSVSSSTIIRYIFNPHYSSHSSTNSRYCMHTLYLFSATWRVHLLSPFLTTPGLRVLHTARCWASLRASWGQCVWA